ncbi:MAG: hypothetical protein JXA25_05000 [Anaerolineales bacterium]|nr:hypothetical protein [Anaerolineales bacterium]
MEQRRSILEQVAEGVLTPEAALPQLESKSSTEQDLCLDVWTGVNRKPRVKIRIPLVLVRFATRAAAPFVDQESQDLLRLLESAAMQEQGVTIQVDEGKTGETVQVRLNTANSASEN